MFEFVWYEWCGLTELLNSVWVDENSLKNSKFESSVKFNTEQKNPQIIIFGSECQKNNDFRIFFLLNFIEVYASYWKFNEFLIYWIFIEFEIKYLFE